MKVHSVNIFRSHSQVKEINTNYVTKPSGLLSTCQNIK
jgi:hypothetical protein